MSDVLTTERLRLVPMGPRHWPGLRDFYASERARFIGGPCEASRAWVIFAADVGHWTLHGFGWWGIEVDGQPAGQVGLWHPPHHEFLELGWTVLEPFEGRGIAREAALAARGWARANLPAQPLTSYIAHGNEGSERLARRLGAEPWHRREGMTIWRHPDP